MPPANIEIIYFYVFQFIYIHMYMHTYINRHMHMYLLGSARHLAICAHPSKLR